MSAPHKSAPHMGAPHMSPGGQGGARRLIDDWGSRVRANREQAERLREKVDRDFYAPVTSMFVVDPRRADDPVLGALLSMASPDETWLDIGAGAGRYALPLALGVRRVIAVEPSPGMRRALRAGLREHGIGNVRVVAGTWPESIARLGRLPATDVSFIAHVGYDIEAIAPFLDAMEAAARDHCMAVLMDRSPGTAADPWWPVLHGEDRVALPALPELVAILTARGAATEIVRLAQPPRAFDSAEALASFLRRQLFIAEGGTKDRRLRAVIHERIAERGDAALLLGDGPGSIGILTWRPSGR
jgi:SAM-dependent methyltransferase